MIDVRMMNARDIKAIMSIDAVSNPFPWRSNSLRECLLNDIVMVACVEDTVIGFAIYYNAVDCLELLLIVTDERHRRMGAGRALMEAGLAMGKEQGFEQCVLEVRQSNLAAQNLYRSLGCQQVGVRKNYYPLNSGHEDALLFSHRYVR